MLTTLFVSPMLTRPDTPATLACEERGPRAILANCEDADMALLDMLPNLYPSVNFAGALIRPTIQN